jgi:hypothetical protein
MSGFFYANKVNRKSAAKRQARAKAPVILAVVLACSISSSAFANPLNWFRSSSSNSKEVRQAESLNQSGAATVQITESALSGQNLDPMDFARTHYDHSRKKLEQVVRAIMHKASDKGTSDLLKKLYIINTQVFKEAIKNSAQAVNELSTGNEGMRRQLAALSRIITSPGQETLDSLEQAVEQLKYANNQQTVKVKKFLSGFEKIIQIGKSAYETLELIPSLPVPGTDMTIAAAKQLMKVVQSNAEAFKGLLLNVMASCDQIVSGLDMVKKTVHETLRFSDHFAIKQFPLINLPAPAREKVYVLLSSLNDSLKGVGNTLTIGDSQLRNTAQQFTHNTSALTAKVAETLKFAQMNTSERANDQISNYAQNQVAGLYQRVKDDIRDMKANMQTIARGHKENPDIRIESRQEYARRKTTSVSQNKLPLFLLGSSGGKASDKTLTAEPEEDQGFVPLRTVKAEQKAVPETIVSKVLYSEKDHEPQGSDLLQTEISILQDELGENFFFADSQPEQHVEDEEMLDEDEELPDHGFAEYEETASLQTSYDNLDSTTEPEIELLKFDLTSYENNSSELLPMMRMNDDTLMFE